MGMANNQLSLGIDIRTPGAHSIDHVLFAMVASHIFHRFWGYHQENPQVFKLFVTFARQLKTAGREYYGAKAIMERIRWHVSVETRGEDFKIGNNHTSCYARLLCVVYPEEFPLNFFNFRNSPGTVRTHE